MTCEKIKEKFADYLTGELDAAALAEVRRHVASCAPCCSELENLSVVWTKLGVLPQEQPSPALRGRFYAMLEAYKEGMEKAQPGNSLRQAISRRVERLLPKRPVYQMALSLALIAAGIGGGYLLNERARSASRTEAASLRQEVKEMRQIVAVSLLKQASPSERLLGVSWSAQLEQPDKEMLETLLDTLDNDPSVSVRLAAADALYLFHDHPRVKARLVHSLALQKSPLVQIALIDLLVEIRERRAAEALQTLIQNEKLNPRVKKRAEEGLSLLS